MKRNEINVGDLVYEKGNEQSLTMCVDSISKDGIVLCFWCVKKKRYEKKFEIELLTKSHPKFGNYITE